MNLTSARQGRLSRLGRLETAADRRIARPPQLRPPAPTPPALLAAEDLRRAPARFTKGTAIQPLPIATTCAFAVISGLPGQSWVPPRAGRAGTTTAPCKP